MMKSTMLFNLKMENSSLVHTLIGKVHLKKIEDAFLYRLEFEIEKDLHLKIFFRSYGLKYKVVRVKVKKSFEVLE